MNLCRRHLIGSIRRNSSNHCHSFNSLDQLYISNTQNTTYFSQFMTCAAVSTPFGFVPRRSYGSSPYSVAFRPRKPRFPEVAYDLTGTRLDLHNRVRSLIHAGDIDNASYVVRQSVSDFERPTVFTCNSVIEAMYRAKRYDDVKDLFHYFFRQYRITPTIASYDLLIVSMCESDHDRGIEEALKVYEFILENARYKPSTATYCHLTKGLVDAGRVSDAVGLLRQMLHKQHGRNPLVYNNVIIGMLNSGNLDKAIELFKELNQWSSFYNELVTATFIDWFFNQGKPKEAMEYYRQLRRTSFRIVPARRNVLLETLLRHGKKKEAWDLFHDMLDDHTPPGFFAVNSHTFNIMVNECFKEGNVEEARNVFQRSGKRAGSKAFEMDVGGFNNMIMRLCELEMMDEAEQYYNRLISDDSLISPDFNTYTTLIDAYIKVDRVDGMIDKYTKMVEAGMRVIPLYANRWFSYLIGKGKAASYCLPILLKMADKEPKSEETTYGIVVRGLVEEGDFDATANLLREMTNQGIETSPSLREYVLGVFDGQGRRSEIENILSECPTPFTLYRAAYENHNYSE